MTQSGGDELTAAVVDEEDVVVVEVAIGVELWHGWTSELLLI